MKLTKLPALLTIMTAALSLSFLGCKKDLSDPSLTSDAKVVTLGTPMLTCNGSTEVSINLLVTAAASGAPAGFSIQWMTAAAYALGADGITGTADDNTWSASESVCKASFSGNANNSRYMLGANESVSINIGELLFDNGTSTNCADGLTCGTAYVFRSFAHANSSKSKSAFSANTACTTMLCEDGGPLLGCTYTQGFWKNHTPVILGGSSTMWPQSVVDNGLSLGNVNYTTAQLLAIFNTPAAGNGILTLTHQLIAAKLNVANNADASAISSSIAAADAMIGNLVAPPVGSGALSNASTTNLVTLLMNYNEGATGPGHCE